MQGFSPSTIAHSLRWQDAVDVLLLTLLFSRLYAWLKHTVAVQIAFGLFTLVLASWVANHFGLILTSYLLSAVGAATTVVIAIVFQHEIRQGLSRVSLLRWLTERRETRPADSMGATIAQAAFSLARRRKGALIVIPRRDSVAEHLTAGTVIEGRLSPALIEAIFTSTSPLHDGAIVVGQNRLASAGVILPLATESAAADHDAELGTRHRAALGLTDNCDALVVCVSEERGSVSLVHGESLETFDGEATLIARAGAATGSARRRPPTAQDAAQVPRAPAAVHYRGNPGAGDLRLGGDGARPLARGGARGAAGDPQRRRRRRVRSAALHQRRGRAAQLAPRARDAARGGGVRLRRPLGRGAGPAGLSRADQRAGGDRGGEHQPGVHPAAAAPARRAASRVSRRRPRVPTPPLRGRAPVSPRH